MPLVDLPKMMTPQETATALEVQPATLARWRWSGKGPRFVKYGKHVRYRKEDVLDFIEASVREHTARTG
jgi:predicted site-specific integrase-resolvase